MISIEINIPGSSAYTSLIPTNETIQRNPSYLFSTLEHLLKCTHSPLHSLLDHFST